MAETVAQLDARLARLAREQAFAVEHRNFARDAELSLEIDRLKRRRALLAELWRIDGELDTCFGQRRGAVARREWELSEELNRQINGLRGERAALVRNLEANSEEARRA